MATHTQITDYLGVTCTCKHCGHEWMARTSRRPLCCPNHCAKQWRWDTDPSELKDGREKKPRKK